MAAQLSAGKRVVVLGGGLSGLSFVHYVRNFLLAYKKSHLVNRITLLEANNYMGGSVKTKTFDDGVVHELGPRSVRYVGAKSHNTVILMEHLGLSDEIVTVDMKSRASRDRHIYKDGSLHLVPASLRRLFNKLPASNVRLISVLKNDIRNNQKMNLDQYPHRDPPLYDFVKYRFGEEAAESIVDPLLRGITAGDARNLSTKAMFSDMLAKEQAYGSIIKGQFKPPLSAMVHDDLFPHDHAESKLLDKFDRQGVVSFNLKSGLQTLPEHLSNSLLNTNQDKLLAIYSQTKVNSIHFNQSDSDKAPCSVVVDTIDGDKVEIEADHIVSSITADSLAKILPDTMPAAQKKALENVINIQHVPVGCVCVEYRGLSKQLPNVLKSFGFLTHSKAGSKVLGISFDSSMFPQIDARTDSFRMTAMMGGAWYKQIFGTDNMDQVTDAQMEQIALEEIRKILKINQDPYRMTSYLWKTGIAQYTPGHGARVAEARENMDKLKMPLMLLGQSYDGVAVNDVIYSARQAANMFVKSL